MTKKSTKHDESFKRSDGENNVFLCKVQVSDLAANLLDHVLRCSGFLLDAGDSVDEQSTLFIDLFQFFSRLLGGVSLLPN